MIKTLSVITIVIGLLLFTYGAMKLAELPQEQIQAPAGFEIQPEQRQRQIALHASGAGVVLALLGTAVFFLAPKRRTN